MVNNLQLNDLGERRIIKEIFKSRYLSPGIPAFGDDCAFVSHTNNLNDSTIVATTDPCPIPMSRTLGFGDYYYDGWLLATINLSDLSAAGALPLALLTSFILPNEFSVDNLIRLVDGIDDCCNQFGTNVVGGNIKEGNKVDLSATAIGVCRQGLCMSRIGCKKGDLIVVLGDLGLFWAGVLAKKKSLVQDEDEKKILYQNILKPTPKVKLGMDLANEHLLTACIDNSDGLYPSLIQLSDENNVQMHVSMESVKFPKEVIQVGYILKMDPIRFALGWGDWQLIGCIDPSNLERLKVITNRNEVNINVIGSVRDGHGVFLEHDGRIGEMIPLDSQRFTKDSWFTAGLDSYIESLVSGPLWVDS